MCCIIMQVCMDCLKLCMHTHMAYIYIVYDIIYLLLFFATHIMHWERKCKNDLCRNMNYSL